MPSFASFDLANPDPNPKPLKAPKLPNPPLLNDDPKLEDTPGDKILKCFNKEVECFVLDLKFLRRKKRIFLPVPVDEPGERS